MFGPLYLWPVIERRKTVDGGPHNLLDRPRDNSWRAASGAALFTWVATIFFAGSADRAFVQFGVPCSTQLWLYRGAVLLPTLVYFLTRRICEELRRSESHPLRGNGAKVISRTPEGGFEENPPSGVS